MFLSHFKESRNILNKIVPSVPTYGNLEWRLDIKVIFIIKHAYSMNFSNGPLEIACSTMSHEHLHDANEMWCSCNGHKDMTLLVG